MICDQLSELIGFQCCPLTAAGDVAFIATPFRFADGDGLPVYTEIADGQVRFFDDGGVVMHFLGQGLRLDNKRRLRFISSAAEEHGLTLTESGEIEVWTRSEDAPGAFAKYIGGLLSIAAWEKAQEGVSQDTSHFLDEVVLALRAWKPKADLVIDPDPIEGISGQLYQLDAMFEGRGVLVTGTHHAAIGSNLRKLVDLRTRPANHSLEFMVVIDDRADPELADRESKVMQALAAVMPFTQLERNAASKSSAAMH